MQYSFSHWVFNAAATVFEGGILLENKEVISAIIRSSS